MGKQVRGPFVKMVVPCSRLISQPFLTSWAERRDDERDELRIVETSMAAGGECRVAHKVAVMCVHDFHITASFDERWAAPRFRRAACGAKGPTRSQQSGCVLWGSRTYHSQLCWLLWCISVVLKIDPNFKILFLSISSFFWFMWIFFFYLVVQILIFYFSLKHSFYNFCFVSEHTYTYECLYFVNLLITFWYFSSFAPWT